MDPFDESSVLIPSATLEDFPVGGSDSDARSLLAGWTVLWHPVLLAQTQQVPTWYRADAPPNPDGPRVIVVPEPSQETLPSDFRRRCEANPQCLWVTGADRAEMMASLGLEIDDPKCGPLKYSDRELGIQDFFAAGYLSLQIQIMTRRLRYTSNLDELYLQGRIVAAAQAFLDRDAQAAAEGLHDVFDCLSEERDHYFSSDPHLIDLNLLTPSVLDKALETGWDERLGNRLAEDDESNSILRAPSNVLIDGEVAAHLNGSDNEKHIAFCKRVSGGEIGWAGGGPPNESNKMPLDGLTMSQAVSAFAEGTQLAESAIGVRPSVYGRLSGLTPSDLIPTLASLGYRGVMPLDFVAGTGFGDESKVLLSSGSTEIEALTAKPIDASSDRSFLSLGAQLGEAIDTGEIATALLTHWPDQVCDSFLDLCRAATWCVALGKFWSIEKYFRDGERPYHSGSVDALSKQSVDSLLATLGEPERALSLMASDFCQEIARETSANVVAIASIASPALLENGSMGHEEGISEDEAVASALGGQLAGQGTAANVKRIVSMNSQCVASRQQATLAGGAPEDESYIYAATKSGGGNCAVTFDVPAMGFTQVAATTSVKGAGLWKKLWGGNKGIAEDAVLKNQFMAVSISEDAGGISGVYSASRGNRLSMRFVAIDQSTSESGTGEMVCTGLKILRSDPSVGIMETRGEIRNDAGRKMAIFRLAYRLERGSRRLAISGCITPEKTEAEDSGKSLWKNCFAIRTAVASEAPTIRALVRDKIHRCTSRRVIAPLGLLIDEVERQTVLTGHGLPLHRIVSDRFVDTPLGKVGQSEEIEFEFSYVLDSPHPVATARGCLVPSRTLALDASGGKLQTSQAWLVHVSAKETLVTDIKVARRADGKLAARFNVIQTRPKASEVRLQFCTFVSAAFLADEHGIDRPLEELPEDVRCNDGVIEFSLGSHQALDMVAVFDV